MDREPVALGGDLLLCSPNVLPRFPRRIAVHLLDPLRHRHRRPQRRIAGIRDRLAAVIEHHPPAVMLEDRPVGPSVAMKIGELRVLRAVVEIGEIGEELRIGKPVLRRRFVRVGEGDVDRLFRGRIALLVRVDQIAVRFLVPPHVADVAVHHRRAGMDVADDALAGGDPAPGGEAVLDRMAALPTRDHRIDREALAAVAELRVRPGMDGGAVVGVDHMAAGAAAGAVVTGMVVGAEEVERRIEEARLREAHEYRIGAVLRSQAPRSQPGPRPPRLLEALGVAGVGPEAPAALEDPQDVPRLHPLEPRQGIEIADHPLEVELLGRRRRHVLQPLADAVHAIALAVRGVLHGDRAVVVEGGAPEHAAVRHHALAHLEDLGRVASAATDVRHPQIARVDEADELRGLVVEKRVGADRIGRPGPRLGLAGVDVGPLLRERIGVAAVAVGAADPHVGAAVHVPHSGVAGDTAVALPISFHPGLLRQIDPQQVLGKGEGIGRVGASDRRRPLRCRAWRIGSGRVGPGGRCHLSARRLVGEGIGPPRLIGQDGRPDGRGEARQERRDGDSAPVRTEAFHASGSVGRDTADGSSTPSLVAAP